MSKVVLPSQQVTVDTLNGVDPLWYERFQQLVAFQNLFSEINFATMATGDTVRWNATTKKFTAGV